jgi:hypothetical protein
MNGRISSWRIKHITILRGDVIPLVCITHHPVFCASPLSLVQVFDLGTSLTFTDIGKKFERVTIAFCGNSNHVSWY